MLRGSKLCASPPDSHENADDMEHIEDMKCSSLARLTCENKHSVEGKKTNVHFSRIKLPVQGQMKNIRIG